MEVLLEILFWFSFTILFFCYFGYPFTLWIYSLFNGVQVNKGNDYYPSVTLIISAYNEEKVIEKKIQNCLKIKYPKLQIVIVSDGSTDRTKSICKRYSDYIRLFHYEENQGKNTSLNKTLVHIESDIVIFSDANCFYNEDAVEKLVQNFSDNRIGCVVGQLKLIQTDRSNIAKGEGLYWRYEHMLKILESKIGQLSIANGSIFAIRKNLLMKLEPDIANDFQIPMRIGSKGLLVIYEPSAIACEKTALNVNEEFNRKIRIVNRGLVGFLKMRKEIRGIRFFEFIFHKLVRWFTSLLSLIILVTSLGLCYKPFFLFILLGQIIFYFFAFIGFIFQRPEKLFYVPYYFCMVHWSALIGVVKVLLGQTFSKWQSPDSSR